MKLILASGSPRRRELLGLYTRDFEVCVSKFDERSVRADTPAALAEALARGKCLAVAADHPGCVVVGSDTVVELDGEIFGKPRDAADALPQVGRVYACITYGTKTVPVAVLSALRCAEATHTELEIGGLYYGEVQREGSVIQAAHLREVTVLYRLAGLVGGIHDTDTAEEVFRQLIWVCAKEE